MAAMNVEEYAAIIASFVVWRALKMLPRSALRKTLCMLAVLCNLGVHQCCELLGTPRATRPLSSRSPRHARAR